jgi:hypothetical protein
MSHGARHATHRTGRSYKSKSSHLNPWGNYW